MAKCDLCGKSCKAHDLVQLIDSYQVDGIVDICGVCKKWANKLKGDMLDEIGPRMRAAIAVRKGLPPQIWWRRLMQRRIL